MIIYSKIFQFDMISLLMKIWLWTQGKWKQQHKNVGRVLTINKIGKVKSNWKEKVCLERRLEWHRTVHQLGYDVDRNLKIMTISTCRLSLLLMMWCQRLFLLGRWWCCCSRRRCCSAFANSGAAMVMVISNKYRSDWHLKMRRLFRKMLVFLSAALCIPWKAMPGRPGR